ANYYNKLYYHRLGTAQSADRLVYERSDQKEWGFDGHVTDDGRYLIIHVWMGTHRRNAVFYQDLTGASDQVVELLSAFDAAYLFVGNAGSQFYFQTDLDAPNGRVIAIDIERPEPTAWRTVVPEHDDALETASLIGERFVATYLRHAHSRLVVMDGDGRQVAEAPLPGIGTVTLVRGNQDQADAYYHFASFVQPGMVLHYDVETGLQHVFREPELPFDPEAFTTQQIFFKSKDGTRIPMFITSHNERSGSEVRPTLLHGYGGFNLAKTPSFLVAALAWMEMGGVFAQASLRGGGEYGKGWHDAGRLGNKQNVFDDFIAAAEYLIAEGYTRPEKLAIWGRSNGGLLVGACMSQRPELFGAAVPQVGVLDMLRFHKFTIGWAWISDYGSPEKPDDFETLLAYSPYHNLEADTVYPATLILTGDHDDRVYPAHSFKFAAALQAAARQNEAPILIRIETRTGHGVGKPTAMLIAEVADMLAFLKHALAGS
ncbi:MAG: prolyl oligopeptidase family serine peptidase, partial [Candidatus Promineifilaceae bacterium]|nr:prolyl oligopeptidase family serine peptidase [Candidatus Promineifilaceae bacterium]